MGLGIITIVFLVLVVGWTLLPFLPAIREVRRPGDIAPLPVSRESQVDIGHFAAGFSEQVDRQFGELIADCRETGEPITGELTSGQTYLIIPDDEATLPLAAEEQDFCERIVISNGDLKLLPNFVHAAEIKAEGNVVGGEAGVYRAILAGGSLQLAESSTSLRWLHAEGDLVAGPTCLLRGRVSSHGVLRVEPGCRFERLQAPVVDFGLTDDLRVDAATPPSPDSAQSPLAPENVPHLKNTQGGRWLVDRRFELAAGEVLATDIVVRGSVILRRGSVVHGNIKSRGEMILEADVRVAGSLVSEKDLTLGEDSFVSGPVICEATLTLQRGSRIGTRETPSTVSSAFIQAEPGARCHGTVWAHERGDVLVPEVLATTGTATGGDSA